MMQFPNDKSNELVTESFEAESKLISDEMFPKAIYANVIIATVVGVFGTLANVLIIIIFFKQGFNDTIRVSLTSLAAVDMGSLICLTWMSTCYNPSFKLLVAKSFDSMQIAYLFGAIPRSHLMLVGSWITAVIASERCICVIRPLEVKYILTKSRLKVVLAVIFTISLIPIVPLYYSTKMSFYYDVNFNATRMGIMFTDDRPHIDLQFSGISVAIFVSAFITVTVSSVVIVSTLVSQSRWRSSMMSYQPSELTNQNSDEGVKSPSSNGNQRQSSTNKECTGNKRQSSNGLSQRDRKAAQTVSLIALMFVVCYFPGILNLLAEAFVPGFKIGGRFANAYQFFWSVSHTTEAICSSANIFVYMKNSTNFRTTMKTLFKFRIHKQ